MPKRSNLVNRAILHAVSPVLLLILFPGYLSAKSDTIPLWLDTIAPQVTIHPASKWQSSVFQITLNANERAVLVDISGIIWKYGTVQETVHRSPGWKI